MMSIVLGNMPPNHTHAAVPAHATERLGISVEMMLARPYSVRESLIRVGVVVVKFAYHA